MLWGPCILSLIVFTLSLLSQLAGSFGRKSPRINSTRRMRIFFGLLLQLWSQCRGRWRWRRNMAAGCIGPPASGKGRSFSKDLSHPGLTGLGCPRCGSWVSVLLTYWRLIEVVWVIVSRSLLCWFTCVLWICQLFNKYMYKVMISPGHAWVLM